ncbi:terminase large subunit domain-containing protein [Magnetococcus sp. PR-3]|uniref:terminase large subunit domain-containing protein n=1 Tax=Magnetococcus sp. PR-3 TaxID=3120355 RepID=UPI002FCE5548
MFPDALPMQANAPDVLLYYQQHVNKVVLKSTVVIVEKSRRIGITWGIAALATLTAAAAKVANGQNVYYIGYEKEMTREFIDTCAMWAKAWDHAVSEIQEEEVLDKDTNGNAQKIQAFRITFASGFSILALSSSPRNLRGRQGLVIIDEAAFHDDLAELMKAALALLMWGGRVVVVSTHNGENNPFNGLVNDCRSGRKPYALIRITLEDAVEQGLYKRICLVKGIEWTQEGENRWVENLYDEYGDDANEELKVIPKSGSGRWLNRMLVEGNAKIRPIKRWQPPEGMADWDEGRAARETKDWIESYLTPTLRVLNREHRHAVGVDVGRVSDLTIIWVEERTRVLKTDARMVIELSKAPFSVQRQIIKHIANHLPQFSGLGIDGRGLGMQIAEELTTAYGQTLVHTVQATREWYRNHMPPVKADLEDRTTVLPRDVSIIDDFLSIVLVDNIPTIPKTKTKDANSGGTRHGDAVVSKALCRYAWAQELPTTDMGQAKPVNTAQGWGDDKAWDDDEERDWVTL